MSFSIFLIYWRISIKRNFIYLFLFFNLMNLKKFLFFFFHLNSFYFIFVVSALGLVDSYVPSIGKITPPGHHGLGEKCFTDIISTAQVIFSTVKWNAQYVWQFLAVYCVLPLLLEILNLLNINNYY